MARASNRKAENPIGKSENLKSFGKDKPPLTPEKAREYGRRGGKASQDKKRKQITLDKAFYDVMNKNVTGNAKATLTKAGFTEDEQTNAHAILLTLFRLALDGDKDAMKIVVDYQKSLTEDVRKAEESKARIESMKATRGEDVTVTSSDGNEGSVVIYLPKLEEDPPEEDEEETEEEASGEEASVTDEK